MNLLQNELPPEDLQPGLWMGLDIEMFNQKDGQLHRPFGDFACISVAVPGNVVYQIYDTEMLPELFKRIDSAVHCYHNATYDIRQLRRWASVPERAGLWDTMLVERNLFSGYFKGFGLNDVTLRWLQIPMDKSERDEFKNATEMTQEMKEYAAMDAVCTLKVAEHQYAYIQQQGSKRNLNSCFSIDTPMTWAVLDMPPVRVNDDRWDALAADFKQKFDETSETLGFNPRSSQQTIAHLEKMSKKKLKSSDKEALAGLRQTMVELGKQSVVDLIDTISQAREYGTAVSKYGAKWLKNHSEDGFVYSSWNISEAKTGRMSSSGPNLQNIPARKLPIYREMFIPRDGNVFIVSDVSQQEPRHLAYISKDRTLNEAIINKEDLHLRVAREVYENPEMDKENPLRKDGKAINLGMSYGLTAWGLARRISKAVEECEKIVESYFFRFPGVKYYIDSNRRFALKMGYVETPFGRRSYINPHCREWENNAINSPIQGGAADQTKLAVLFLYHHCQSLQVPFCVVLVVHDEIVLDVPEKDKDYWSSISLDAWKWAGEKVIPGIPMVVDIGIGQNWRCKA